MARTHERREHHDATNPNTIVLIHGFWMIPRSWEKWVERYEGRGYRILAPAYPGLTPPQGGRLHQRAVPLRLRQHA